MWDPYAKFETAVLPNGLTVHCAHWSNRPWVHCGVVVHSGANQDPVGKEGLAHFVEHRVNKHDGTSMEAIKEFVGQFGGQVNLGETNDRRTTYAFFLPKRKVVLTEMFRRFGTMLLRADLSCDEIESERAIILREFYQFYPTTKRYARFLERRKLFYDDGKILPVHDIGGSPESIAMIAPADLQEFYSSHYTPANMTLLCVGGLKLEKLLEMLRASPFADQKPGTRTPRLEPLLSIDPFAENRKIIHSLEENPNSTQQTANFETVARAPHADPFARYSIARAMLQHVLYTELRTRHSLVYHTEVTAGGNGRFVTMRIVMKGLDPDYLERVEALVDEGIQVTAHQEKLFRRIKKQFLHSFSMTDVSAGQVFHQAAGHLIGEGRIVPLRDSVRIVEDLTMDDIREVLTWLAPEKRWTSILRP